MRQLFGAAEVVGTQIAVSLLGRKCASQTADRRTSLQRGFERKGKFMSNTTLIIVIVVLVLLFGGGGFYWRSRR